MFGRAHPYSPPPQLSQAQFRKQKKLRARFRS